MTKKVKLAIFDKDLKARTVGMFPVSDDGKKIKVKSGGKGHYHPEFDNESFIEFPKRFGGWDRIYFVRRAAKKCVNFKTEEVATPSIEVVEEAAKNSILRNIGREDIQIHPIFYIMFLAIIGIALKVFGVIA